MRAAIRAVAPCLSALTAGCAQGVLHPRGPIAAAERLILLDATIVMLAVIVPVILLTAAFAVWFRAGNGRARYRPDWAYSGRLELLVWAIPALVILFLGGMAWVSTHALDPPRAIRAATPPLEVEVVSLDWKWLFIYPAQGVASIGRLVVPTGTPVRFRLTSASVMNSFLVPQLGGQIYAMHGMTTQLNLLAAHDGTYPGLSAQYSGNGFSDMRFVVEAVPPARFAAWIGAAKRQPAVLDGAAYAGLLRQGRARPPFVYGRVQPGLFAAASSDHAPSGAGPAVKAGGRQAEPRGAR